MSKRDPSTPRKRAPGGGRKPRVDGMPSAKGVRVTVTDAELMAIDADWHALGYKTRADFVRDRLGLKPEQTPE